MLADKVVPALISDLDKKGIKNVKKSKWQLVFSYVPKKGDVGYIKGDISWIDAKGKTHKTSFIKEFSRTINDTARSLSATIKSHVSKGYWGRLEKDSWKIELDDVPEYWKFRREKVLVDQLGKAYPVNVKLKDGEPSQAELMTGGFLPVIRNSKGQMLLYVALDRRADAKARMGKSQLKGLWEITSRCRNLCCRIQSRSSGEQSMELLGAERRFGEGEYHADGKIWQSYSFRSQKEKDNHISFRGRRLSHL